jgi:hypothetical protein
VKVFGVASAVIWLLTTHLPMHAAPGGAQAPDLGRPTKLDDVQPLLNFRDYFVGKWEFEWEMPDGPLGPGGLLTGSVVYKHLEGPFFEAVTSASGPEGAVTIREAIAYRDDAKTVSRYVNDSRGFAFQQMGRVGGDLGGTYTLHYESAPFTFKGKTIRIRNTIKTQSPYRYRNNMMVSVDKGEFVNYGNPWFEKDRTAPPAR